MTDWTICLLWAAFFAGLGAGGFAAAAACRLDRRAGKRDARPPFREKGDASPSLPGGRSKAVFPAPDADGGDDPARERRRREREMVNFFYYNGDAMPRK